MRARQEEIFPSIDEDMKAVAEQQIVLKQKEADFDIREYPVEVIVSKYLTKLDNDTAELFVPDYQRELVWLDDQQSRFIESVLLDLPVPYLYVADISKGENEGRLEIVDGSQRIRTLVRFMQDDLKLEKLELLDKLNGFRYTDLPQPRQLRFRRKTLRMIELIEVDEDVRRQLFDRLNSGGTKLLDMEQRMGSRDGKFMVFIRRLATYPTFKALCPVSEARVKRREYEELVLRFFAYKERYKEFDKRVDEFLDVYLDDKNRGEFDEAELSADFERMLNFVNTHCPYGFRKNIGNTSVPRIRFEAIAIGTALALAEKPDLEPSDMTWLESDDFKKLTRSDASNSKPRVINRIHFVRDSLLGRSVEMAGEELVVGR